MTEEGNMFMVNEDQFPHVILREEAADLSALKTIDSQQAFLEQRGDPVFVASPIACRLEWQRSSSEEKPAGETEVNKEDVTGNVFISSSQILFACEDASNDVAIGATCILMHAMTEEPELSIYLQLQEDGCETLEATFTPLDSNMCQDFFNALCKLVSLHPCDGDDDEGDEMFGQEDMIWAPASRGFGTDAFEDEERGATDDERQAMLDRLDSILVVQPEYEIQEGQFDDPILDGQFEDAEESGDQ
ncbi:unnamed protein product [Cylindrotheca closterium]|uniref:Methylosome subunit pICln n=1 Tax=Cylindrotheca closterium TaxID=2856 RepID=A0AAD2G8G6_9STRA|nr:unnamed protein product [Cylindrotheca closterium]